MTEQPLVSCIMPTSNRRRFVGQAIWYFLRQDLASRELIVVDDGADGIADLLPGDERIRYVRLERRLPLGAKRNLACELAGGELIAHWDDDDWIGPDRLRLQVEALLAGDADICGADAVLHYWLERGQVRRDRRRSDAGPRLAGGTLLYRRSAWGARRFPEIDVGEDGAFVGHFPPDRVRVLSDPPWYVAVIHPGSTAARNLADPRWEPRPMEELNQRLDLDQDFYAALRRGGPRVVSARPATPMSAVNRSTTVPSAGASTVNTGGPAASTRTGIGSDVNTSPVSVPQDAVRVWSPGVGKVTISVPPPCWANATCEPSSRTSLVLMRTTGGCPASAITPTPTG